MDRQALENWVARYERAWRSPGTASLLELFTPDISYLPSPWADPHEGLDAVERFWEAERDGPDEEFEMSSEVVAVDGPVAVVRVFVDYGAPGHSRWRDLWVMRFADDGRCSSFEEWPFAPRQSDGH